MRIFRFPHFNSLCSYEVYLQHDGVLSHHCISCTVYTIGDIVCFLVKWWWRWRGIC